ncbi:uncharacterized protein IUM83_17592 [Phytophthora cinnamomi]|uniref:uncharacterized protein n=1 Tax=Phytophthora cinnamomi TaxID=4785 RepID=UPI00355A349B|nr:hypothetical protein IUM83_17592 [Phytophthora cinnamomi]
METLSPPAVACICSFLSDLDVLSLSHCSSFWLRQLDAAPLWEARVPAQPEALHAVAYKALYQRLKDCNFGFDLWFALLPQEPDRAYTGGILYGLQSVQAESRNWPQFHQQFVLPTPRCLPGRGKVRSDTGALHREMEFLTHEQVGTGCITANELHFPTPGYLGWYGFHGLIDEFRVWGDVLTERDVAELARGQNAVDKELVGTLKPSGRAHPWARWNTCEVRCSRPLEGRQVQMVKYSSRRRIAVVRPEQLPSDTIETLCSYLTGFDAFNLSHTNHWWMKYLADESQWQRGFQGEDGRQVDSYAYFTYAGNEHRRRSQFRLNFLGSESFSFDVWFSLLPGSDGTQFGGILYGLQSASRESRTLSQDDVSKLVRGGSLQTERLRASMKTNYTGERLVRPLLTWVNVQLTICTRPAEGRSMQQVEYRSTSQPNCVIS